MSVAATAVTAPRRRVLPRFITADWGGRVGALLLTLLVAIAVFGPLFAPHSTTEPLGIPGASAPGVFGLDILGRDVLSRLLAGGRTTLVLGALAVLLTYVIGITLGLIAGYTRLRWFDALIMRVVDVFLSVPAVLVMLLMVTGAGNSRAILVLGAALVMFPGVTRIVRTATLEVSTRSYVEAAVARGERAGSVMRREILPNIMSPLVADIGVRANWAIILIASVNFLGLGLQPPTADWGLMISENLSIISQNPWAVVAPALMLALLVVGINLVGDAYVRHLGGSGPRG